MKHLIIIIFLAINFSSCRNNDEVNGTNDGGGSGSSGGSSSSSSSGSTGGLLGTCTYPDGSKTAWRNITSNSDSQVRDGLETSCTHSSANGVWSDSTNIGSCPGSVCLVSGAGTCSCLTIDLSSIGGCSGNGYGTDASDCSGL